MGTAVGLINIGTVLAFVPVRLADRYGRRPMLLVAITGYTLATVATAATQSLGVFVAVQLLARMFMVTEIGLAYVILSEEMPARLRGRANAFMVAFASLGGIAASLSFAPLVASSLGWRGLYLLGGALLPLLPVYGWQLRETRRFEAVRAQGGTLSLWRELAATREVFRREQLRSTLVASSLWFCISVWTGATVFWFTYFAVKERGWDPALVGQVLPVAAGIGLAGYAVVGPAMDLVGRRFAAVAFLALGALATVVCFTAHSFATIAVGYVAVMLFQAVWSVLGTITSEIFPTELRATGHAVSNNLLGRQGMVLSGFLVGGLSMAFVGSVGNAVALLAIAPLAAIPIVLAGVPETRGRALEEIAGA
jgi:putative MFS transporter